MEMRVNHELVKQLRLERSWSQEMLADQADVSLRTIQRIEINGVASLKSRLAVAQALEIDPTDLDVAGEELPAQESSSLEQAGKSGNEHSLSRPSDVQKQTRLNSLPLWLRIPVMTFVWVGILVPAAAILLILITAILIDIPTITGFRNIFAMAMTSMIPLIAVMGIFTPIYWQLQKQARISK